MADIAIQLYTLRAIDEPLATLLDRVGDAGYDGVEFAHRVADAPTDEVTAALDRNDLEPAAAHVGLDALEDDYEATVSLYDELGVDTLIVPWLDPEHFDTPAAVADAAERLDAVASDLADDGFAFDYHNHDQEFVPFDDRTAMDELLAATDGRVGFEVDLGWANVGGVDPAALVDRYADRISHVHFADADVETGEPTELGAGSLDLESAAAAVARADADWYVYEHDEPADAEASLAHGVETLRSLLE
ncbi:sugar phosphate isomerase/epimerase [Halorubrum gandharaense]